MTTYVIGDEVCGNETHYAATDYDDESELYLIPHGAFSLCGRRCSHIRQWSVQPTCEDCIQLLKINNRLLG